MKRKYSIIVITLMIVALFATGCMVDFPEHKTPISEANKDQLLDEIQISFKEVEPVEGEIPENFVRYSDKPETVVYEMPDVSDYNFDVTGTGTVDAEIFLPVDTSSSVREVVKYVARQFNNEKKRNLNGETMSVSIRCLESSLAEDFIKTKTYEPDGYIADNELFGYYMEANNINVEKVASKTVENVIGIAIENEVYDSLKSKNGSIDVKTIVQANIDGDLTIGYTNPLTNPTGLNFVVSMLATFDASNPNSMEASTDFTEFQNSVNSVSYSTDQMIKFVENGMINSFVIDHQTFLTNETLKNSFVFIPFGVRHDYPIYKMASTDDSKKEVLEAFSESFSSKECQNYAKGQGFFADEDYVSNVDPSKYPASILNEILGFWKESKAGQKKIVCMFVADFSGSMSGKKLETLMESMRNAAQYINEDSHIGVIGYDNQVYQFLNIGKFDDQQMKYYFGAIDNLRRYGGGSTATNDALLAAISKVRLEELHSDQSIKPIIILLSDGRTCSGYSLKSVKELIQAFSYPIYTIGYGEDADKDELQEIAGINGGVFMDSTTGDVGFILKNIFNAEM